MLGTQEQSFSCTPIETENLKTTKSTWPGNLQHTQTLHISSRSSTLTKPFESESGNQMTTCSPTVHASKTSSPIISSNQRLYNLMTLNAKYFLETMSSQSVKMEHGMMHCGNLWLPAHLSPLKWQAPSERLHSRMTQS